VSQYELETLWVKGELPTAKLRFDDRVRATSGEHEGKSGRVVALLEIEPSPLYVIEELEGTSFNAKQPELERERI
jgi:ribosomal protein L24